MQPKKETAGMQMVMGSKEKLAALVVFGFASTLTGCASLTTDSKSTKKEDKSWFSFKKKEYQVPQAMNVVWTYDILTLPGKPPTRGFGGRFYFYNEKTQAIPVDGELMVYGFDDSKGNVDSHDLNSAAKRFKFTSEQLTSHFSEGQLGASYSVWIPWDAAPGEEKKIMLIPTFIAKDGRMVKSAPATVNLPGKKVEDVTTIMQVSSQIPVASSLAGPATTPAIATQPIGKGITTINMPNRSNATRLQSPELVDAMERLQATANEQQLMLQQAYSAANQAQWAAMGGDPNYVNGGTGVLPTPKPQLTIQPVFTPPQEGVFPSGTALINTRNQSSQLGAIANGSSLGQNPSTQAIPQAHSGLNGLQVPNSQSFQQGVYPTH